MIACVTNVGNKNSGSMGSIRKKVKVLTVPHDEFPKFIMNNIPAQPMNYKQIVEINKNLISCDTTKVSDLQAGPNSCGIVV